MGAKEQLFSSGSVNSGESTFGLGGDSPLFTEPEAPFQFTNMILFIFSLDLYHANTCLMIAVMKYSVSTEL